MVGTTDSQSYDRFDFRHYDERPLELTEAIRKAAEMRKADPEYIYRVVPADVESTTFHIDKMTAFEVYAEWMSRLAILSSRLLSRKGSRL